MIDVEWAGDFLVMAATLMEIKSKMLLPRQHRGRGRGSRPTTRPRAAAIEYKKFKDAAAVLEARVRSR